MGNQPHRARARRCVRVCCFLLFFFFFFFFRTAPASFFPLFRGVVGRSEEPEPVLAGRRPEVAASNRDIAAASGPPPSLLPV